MKNQRLAGGLFILAAITFWISWFLMPDPGTVDTIHILRIVREARSNVFNSVIVQLISAGLLISSLFIISQDVYPAKKLTLAGLILLGIGSMGLCADAFFHVLAYYMTDESITTTADVIGVMDFMQTKGVILLLPVLLPVFIGSLILAIGLNRQGFISRRPQLIFISVYIISVLTAVMIKTEVFTGPAPSMWLISAFALGLAFVGMEFMRPQNNQFIIH